MRRTSPGYRPENSSGRKASIVVYIGYSMATLSIQICSFVSYSRAYARESLLCITSCQPLRSPNRHRARERPGASSGRPGGLRTCALSTAASGGVQPLQSDCAPVAQRIEQRFPKPRVGCSSHPRGTTPSQHPHRTASSPGPRQRVAGFADGCGGDIPFPAPVP